MLKCLIFNSFLATASRDFICLLILVITLNLQTVWTQIRTNQNLDHSDSVPERFFYHLFMRCGSVIESLT